MKTLAILALLCFSACTHHHVEFVERPAAPAVMLESAVRIRAFCDGELMGYGSGTAVSPSQVLTARHVAEVCEEREVGVDEFEVVTFDGRVMKAVIHKLSDREDVDAAILTVLEPNGAFTTWAEIQATAPATMQDVYMFTGDGRMDNEATADFFVKHGYVALVGSEMLTVSDLHCVPGNSGGGFFTASGKLLAPLWGGTWDPRKEFYCEGWLPATWPELQKALVF